MGRSDRVHGARARPRVAFLGEIPHPDLETYERLFPTRWAAPDISRLSELISFSEVDLLVIYPGVADAGMWPLCMHVICFSTAIDSLPGPIAESTISIGFRLDTEESLRPSLVLPLARRLEADLSGIGNVKGWQLLEIDFPPSLELHPRGREQMDTALSVFTEGAFIQDSHSKQPLATAYQRVHDDLGVAWIPHSAFTRVAWVELICAQWARSDSESFPSFGDWTKRTEWMVQAEVDVVERIADLECAKRDTLKRMTDEIAALELELSTITAEASLGLRRLLTSSGDDLLSAAADAFRQLGFTVDCIDEGLPQGKPKREDLRLTTTDEHGNEWVALVEVRSYSRSSGKTADFQKLARFAGFYDQETGSSPDRLIYVVNGPLDLAPHLRPRPFESSPEDLKEFAKSAGLVVPSLELFAALKGESLASKDELRASLMSSVGLWRLESIAREDAF